MTFDWRNAKRNWLRVRSRLLRMAIPHVLPVRPRSDLERLGSRFGGWVVPLDLLSFGAVCYCAGLGEDGTFDLELANRFGCAVFVFDPTPRAVAYAHRVLQGNPRIEFLPVGVWNETALLRFYAPENRAHVSHSVLNLQRTSQYFEAECHSVHQLMERLGHVHLRLLKLDIEGAEYAVLQAALKDSSIADILCVEFDQPVPVRRTLKEVRAVLGAGYDLVAIDGWNYTFVLREAAATPLW